MGFHKQKTSNAFTGGKRVLATHIEKGCIMSYQLDYNLDIYTWPPGSFELSHSLLLISL